MRPLSVPHEEVMVISVLTVGHSNHLSADFLRILKSNDVTAVADVRSLPKSRAAPWSSEEQLKPWLKDHGIAYSFLGRELGGRPSNKSLFNNHVANYSAMEKTEPFKAGIQRVLEGSKTFRIALMCAERDPLECHRCLLVGRHLHNRSIPVEHILFDGNVETHEESELRLLSVRGQEVRQRDLLADEKEILSMAYQSQIIEFAYSE